jgi:hypothetical protein
MVSRGERREKLLFLRMHRVVYFFCLFLFSCNNNNASVSDEILAEFDSVNRTLEQSDRAVSENSVEIKKKLQRLAETDTAAWNRIVALDDATHSFTAYSDSLSRAFVTFCGADETGLLAHDREDDIGLSTKYFIEQENGHGFYQRLMAFSDKSRAIALTDSTRSFAEELISVPSTITQGPLPPSPERFSKAYFKQVPPVAVLTIIAKFRSDAKLLRVIIFNEYSKLVSSHP